MTRDHLRHGVNRDLGRSNQAWVENILRVAGIADRHRPQMADVTQKSEAMPLVSQSP